MSRRNFEVGGTVSRRYEVLEHVGHGGMGSVVKAKRLRDEEIVAIKYCHLRDSTSRRRFVREVRIMEEIDHRHVVPILATSLTHDPPYFVMPFAESSCGHNLAAYAADNTEAVKAFLQLCEGVQAIHNAGAVHRDIKPDNALVLDGKVVLSDLGLAKLSERDTTILTRTRAIVGTEMYLAPEQRMPGGSRDADHRTDIYQLGKTLYELLTGLDPVLLEMNKVPAGLIHVIRKATREHPDERYQVVGELIDAVNIYRKARDPKSNPIGAFEGALERVNEHLERGEYEEEDILGLMGILERRDIREDPEQFLDLFDRIPDEVLEIMASLYQDEFAEVTRAYVSAIDGQVGERSFSYAESVAQRMRAIFRAPDANPELRAMAIEALLLAAVRLNRFAAMHSLNTLLQEVQEDADALAVREMLENHRREYECVCEQIPGLKLHPTIRELRDQLASADQES